MMNLGQKKVQQHAKGHKASKKCATIQAQQPH